MADSFQHLLEQAQAAMTSGRPKRALRLFHTFLQHRTDNVMVWANVVQIEEQLNHLLQAREALIAAKQCVGQHPMLALVEARLLRREEQSDKAIALLQAVDGTSYPVWFQAARDYEWSRNLDRLKQHDKAFAKAASANRITATLWPSSWPKALQNWLSWLAQEQDIKHIKQGKTEDTAPVFLMGFPRSGTTLLDQMLDSHSRIRVVDEWPLIERLCRELPEPWYEQTAWRNAAWQDKARRQYRDAAMSALGAPWGGRVVDKMPLNLLFLPLIKSLFPDARMLVARRHPLDACLSAFMQEFRPHVSLVPFLDVEQTARYWLALDRLIETWQSAFPEQLLVVSYEKLVERPKDTLETIMSHLGLPVERAQSHPHRHARAKEQINTPSYHQVIEPIYTHAMGRWRRYRQGLAPIIPMMRERAKQHGYSVDG